ncbi:hypothetical protein, partial [Candidatus Anaplasma sp. TIGMIC]|uniref:hypothetical protein n=1 Tax=Candidatus Anaplasma sp. TIGMIC TaxID=3020713 RepID=UPI00232B7624
MQHVSDNIAGSDVKLRRTREAAAEPTARKTAAAARKSVPTNNNSASAKKPTKSPRVRVSSG